MTFISHTIRHTKKHIISMHDNLHVKFPLVVMAASPINLQFPLTLIAVIYARTWIFQWCYVHSSAKSERITAWKG